MRFSKWHGLAFVFLTTLHTTSTIFEVVLLFCDEVYFWAITKLVFVAGFFLFYRRDPPNERACCPLDPAGRIGLGPLAAFRPYCRCSCFDAARRRRRRARREKRRHARNSRDFPKGFDEPRDSFALQDTPTRRRRLHEDSSPHRQADWAEPSPSPDFRLGRGLSDYKVPLLKTGPPKTVPPRGRIGNARSLPKSLPRNQNGGRWCSPEVHPEDWCPAPVSSRAQTRSGGHPSPLLTPPKSALAGSSSGGRGGFIESGEKKRRKVTWDSSVDGGFGEDDEKSPRVSHASFQSSDGLSDSSEEDRSRRRPFRFDRKGKMLLSVKLYTKFYVVPQMITNIARYQSLVASIDNALWHGWDLGEGLSGYFFWISSAICVVLFLGFYHSLWSAIRGVQAKEKLDQFALAGPQSLLDQISEPVHISPNSGRKTKRPSRFWTRSPRLAGGGLADNSSKTAVV